MFFPIEVFNLAPGALKEVGPCQCVVALQGLSLFGNTGAHGKIGAWQVNQVNGCFSNVDGLCELPAQGFGIAEQDQPVEFGRPFQCNIPVAVGRRSAQGTATDEHGKIQLELSLQDISNSLLKFALGGSLFGIRSHGRSAIKGHINRDQGAGR